METNNQKQPQISNKKDSTSSGENDDPPSTSATQPKDIIHEDVCSICMENVSLMDVETYVRYKCCGKVMHDECNKQLHETKSLSAEIRKRKISKVSVGNKEKKRKKERTTYFTTNNKY